MNAVHAEIINTSLDVLAKGYDPGIKPRFDAPWMDFFRTLGGQIIGTVIACLVIFMVIAAVVWVASKIFGAGAGQTMGLQGLLIGVIAAAVIGSVGGAVMYFSGIPLFP